MPDLELDNASLNTSPAKPEDKSGQQAFIRELDTSLISPKFSQTLIMAIIALALVVAEYFVSVALIANKKSQIATLESRIADAKALLITSPLKEIDQEAGQLSSGISAFSQVSASLVDYSKLWSDLQTRVVDGTRLTTLTIANDGSMTITGEGRSYGEIAKLIASLKNRAETIKGVKAVSTQNKDKFVNFSLIARYQPLVVSTNQASQGVK